MNLFACVSISVVLIATVIIYIIFHKNNLKGYRYVLGLVISAAVAVAISLFFPQLVSFFTVNRAMQFVVSLLISIILYVTILFLVMILVSALLPPQIVNKQKTKEKNGKEQDNKKHEVHGTGRKKQKEPTNVELKQVKAQPEKKLKRSDRKNEHLDSKPEKPDNKEDKLQQLDKKDSRLEQTQGSSDQKADRLAKLKEIWKQTIEKWKQIKQKQDRFNGKTTKQTLTQEKNVNDTLVPERAISVVPIESGEEPETIPETTDQMASLAKDTENEAEAEIADSITAAAEGTVNQTVSGTADQMASLAKDTANETEAEITDAITAAAEGIVNQTVIETADSRTAPADDIANEAVTVTTDDEIQAETENESENADDLETLKEDDIIENAVLSLSNLPENNENTEKNVDTSDIIDKMGIDMVSDTTMVHPELNGSGLDQTIEKAFLLKQEGRQIEAATLFMEALDKEPDLETTFWIVLDLCAIYKNAGQIGLAEDILLSYVEQYEDLMSEEIKDQIFHSLYM